MLLRLGELRTLCIALQFEFAKTGEYRSTASGEMDFGEEQAEPLGALGLVRRIPLMASM